MSRDFLVRCVVLMLAAGVAGASLAPGASAGQSRSPDRQILIVSNNLEEAYRDPSGLGGGSGGNDLANMREVRVFADRVADRTPYEPDVVLLQEVNRQSTAYAARQLSRKVGTRYVIAVNPIRNTTIERRAKQIHTETAILLNRATMREAGKGGYIATSYERSAAEPGTRVQVKKQAFTMAEERATGVKVPLASVHFVPVKMMRSKRVSNTYRGRWSKQIHRKLQKKYRAGSDRRVATIGGDFNTSRCVSGEFASCREAAFWRILTRRLDYIDATRDGGVPSGVDFIFSRGALVQAGWDQNGKARPGSRNFYSGHRFRWAVLTPRSQN